MLSWQGLFDRTVILSAVQRGGSRAGPKSLPELAGQGFVLGQMVGLKRGAE